MPMHWRDGAFARPPTTVLELALNRLRIPAALAAKPLLTKRSGLWQRGTATLLLLAAGATVAWAQPVRSIERPALPALRLSVDRAHGAEALQLLGSQLPAVASAHGMDAADLTQRLKTDRSLWLDRTGRLLYVEQGLTAEGTTANTAIPTGGGATTSLQPELSDSDTFTLHSRPGAKRTIYLDFDGHSATGTSWNTSYGIPSIVSPAFSLDDTPGTFSSSELQRIRAIWQRVAEDYAPFDVNVSTQAPSFETLNRSSTSDEVYGIRVVVTTDFTAATSKPCGCGGFAYLSVFNSVNNAAQQPAYVFYSSLGGGNEKYVAEAISHEAGHTLGLNHDGSSSVAYYTGHGSGAVGWAPIMGVGYYKEVSQWSKGEYTGANNRQDDLTVLQQMGAPLLPDDHGGSAGSATPMSSTPSGSQQLLSSTGLISNRADVDVFSFTAAPGALSLTLAGATLGANLDASLSLSDANGVVLATSNPTTTLGAVLSVNLAKAGQYFVSVDGVGAGSLSTGYSDYGSLGQYQITGSAPLFSGSLPQISLSASATSGVAPFKVLFNGSASDSDGNITSYLWKMGNGTSSSLAPPVEYTYTKAGSYVATLTATDNSGLSSTASVPITVTAPIPQRVVFISAFSISLQSLKMTSKTPASASATVQISLRDAIGNRLSVR